MKIIFVIVSLVLSIYADVSSQITNCYQLKDESRAICLGHRVNDPTGLYRDANKILQGHCYSLGETYTYMGIGQVCRKGREGCYSIPNYPEAQAACLSCNGSNQWARVFASGTIMNCY